MTMTIHWIKQRRRRWHAWEHGSRASRCGRVNTSHLQQDPPDEILTELQPEHLAEACKSCVRSVQGAGIPELRDESAVVRAWYGHLLRHARRVHARPGVQNLRTLTRLLAEVGAPDNHDAQVVYLNVRDLLIAGGKNAVGLKAALAKMPPSSGKLAQVAQAMEAWRKIVGRRSLGRHRPDQVIETMLQVPEPEAYVRHLKARGFEQLSAVWHPNVLERARSTPSLRGLFGGGHQYWKETREQLRVIE